jgi:hypothetical protein
MQQVFFYDVPIQLTKNLQVWQAYEPYLQSLTSGLAISHIPHSKGCLGVQANQNGFNKLLNNFHQIFTTKPPCIIIYLDSLLSIRAIIENYFKITMAAGGVVVEKNKVLMIYRLGKWDLPKGKLELQEPIRQAAVREVYEECGIKAIIKQKLCSTWHNYTQDHINFLKKTTWYTMDCIETHNMSPQKTEGITELSWMDTLQQQVALQNSYASIRYVLDVYAKGLLMI